MRPASLDRELRAERFRSDSPLTYRPKRRAEMLALRIWLTRLASAIRHFARISALLDSRYLVDAPLMASATKLRVDPGLHDFAQQYFSDLVAGEA
jgi:hypothetical protein